MLPSYRFVMDRENPFAPGWSHVLSVENDISALRAFGELVGAPKGALQRVRSRWPHLDLRGAPRQRALALDGAMVRVYDSAYEMLRFLRTHRTTNPKSTSQ